MDGQHQHNNLKRKEPEDALDLNLRLGISNPTEQAESSNSQAVNQTDGSSVNHVNPELGFAMMAGEHNNPWRNVRPRFNGSTLGSSVMNTDVHSQSSDFNYQRHPVQGPNVLPTDVIGTRSGYPMAPEPYGISFYIFLQAILNPSGDVMLARQFDDFIREFTNGMHSGEGVEAEAQTDDSDLPEFNFDDLEEETGILYDDLQLDIDDMSYEDLLGLEEQMGIINSGLTEETISGQLRRYVYSQPNVSGPEIEEARCCICLDEFNEGDLVGNLDCGHEFHYDCVKEWLIQKNECPLCKSTALSV